MVPTHNGKQSEEEDVCISKNIYIGTHVLRDVGMCFSVFLKKCSCNNEFSSLIHKG